MLQIRPRSVWWLVGVSVSVLRVCRRHRVRAWKLDQRGGDVGVEVDVNVEREMGEIRKLMTRMVLGLNKESADGGARDIPAVPDLESRADEGESEQK